MFLSISHPSIFIPQHRSLFCHHYSPLERVHMPFGLFLLSCIWACFISTHVRAFLASLCVSVCSSVLLVFMAAPSLSSHFLPQITAAEQQPVSRAAAVTVSAAGPSWKLHAGDAAAPTSTAVAEWLTRHQTRARFVPPLPLFL